MNDQQLHVFLKVAETGSLTKAASELCYAPQSVKNIVDALERDLGRKLFERTNRGVRLTDAGTVLKGRAPALLQAVAETRRAVRQGGHPNGEPERLKVLALAHVRYRQRDALIEEFASRYPDVEVVTVPLPEETSEQYLASIATGYADLAIARECDVAAFNEVAAETPGASLLEYHPCDRLPAGYQCLMHHDHELARQHKAVTPRDLTPYPVAHAGWNVTDATPAVDVELVLPYEPYAIEGFCRSGGVVVCIDEFQEIGSSLVSLPLRDVPPGSFGLTCRSDAPSAARLFISTFCKG